MQRVGAEPEHRGSKLGRQRASAKFSEKFMFCFAYPPFKFYVTIKPFLVCKGSGRTLSVTNTINDSNTNTQDQDRMCQLLLSTHGEEEAASRMEIKDPE